MILAILPGYDTFAEKPSDKGKPDFVVNIKELKKPQAVKLPDGRIAEKVVHIFYNEEFSHKPNHNKGGGPPDKGGKGGGEGCFAIVKGVNWRNTEPYIINPTNDDFAESMVASIIDANIGKWDDQVASFNIFGSSSVNPFILPTLDSPDDNNIVAFGEIDEQGVIAVATIWGVFSGPPQTRGIISWDIVFNDPDYLWGNAGDTSDDLGDTDIMDFDNIANHEIGHAAGMNHPADTCSEETMYAFAEEGETKKRTLNPGDIAGIKKLY